MRYIQIDGLRGLMLISMAIGHLGSGLSLGVTHTLVFKTGLINDSASAFVFLSGLTVAIAYAKGWLDPAHEPKKRDLRNRALLIFLHHSVLVILVTLAAVLIVSTDRPLWILQPYGQAPLLFGALSIATVAAGWCLDILPMYLLFLALTPAALAAVKAGRRWLVIAAVAAAWTAGQTGALEYFWDASEMLFGLHHHDIELGLDFNRLSWSAFYFSGLLLGVAFVRGEFDLAVLNSPRLMPAFLASVTFIVVLMLILALYLHAVVTDHLLLFAWLISKQGVGVLSLLNFFATTFVVAWLLVAGPTSPYGSMQVVGRKLNQLLQWKPLVFLGQHSLSVFSFHVAGVYLFYLLVDTNHIDPWLANVILVLGVLSLAIPAILGRHLRDRKRPPLCAAATQVL